MIDTNGILGFKLFVAMVCFSINAQITTNGLVLNLDASDPSSFSGSGSTWNDTSGNNKDFNINTATYNNDGYFVFDGNDGMTGPPSNSFGLSQTDHTIEIVLMNTTITNQTIINFKGNGETYGINAHVPWNNNNIYYDVGGCCGGTQRINGAVNILNQKVHVILRSKPSGSNRRQVFLNGNSILGSGGNSTSNPGFSTGAANIGFLNAGGHSHYHKGRLYSVRVYNRALTDQEIANNYSYYQNPRNISLTSTTVSESVSIGTSIGTLSSSGMNQNGTFTYTLASSGNSSDDDNGSFTISGTTLITSSTFDYETKTSYNIYVNVNDGTTNFAKAFTISITNINEAPMDLEFASNQITQNGLLIYVDANNPNSRGTNQWTDLSGNGNHATVTGGALGNNYYYTLDGNDHFKWSTDVLSAGSSFTMQVRLKTTNNNWHGSMPLYNTFGPSDSGFWHHFQANGTLGSTLGTMGTANSNDGVGIVQDQWQLTTLTYDGSAMKLYKNGTLEFTKQGALSWNLANSGASAGKLNYRSSGSQYFFHGLISSQLIYNRALTQTEIEGNYGVLNGTASTSTSTASFDEGSAVGTVVAILTATDSDTTNLIYSLATGNGTNDQHNSLFTVSGTQLLVASSTISYDIITSLNINLQVSDGANTLTKEFTISVKNVNFLPTDISLTSNTISENATTNTVVGILSAVDSDTYDSHTFTLASSGDTQDDDNGSFTISGTTLITSSTLDYETKTSYNIYVKVSDGTTDFAKSFTISITNINEPPIDIRFTKNNISYDGILLHLDSGVSNSYPGNGNTWADLSGNNFNGILQNSPIYSNSTDGLINFNGSTQWIQLDSFAGELTNNSSYTVNLWFKSTETNTSGNIYNNAIFSMHTSSGGNIFRLGAAPDSGRGLYYNFGVGSPEGRASSINLHDNQWHNALITKDTGAQAQFYIDNNLVTTNNVSTNGTPFDNVGKVSIGQEYDGSNKSDHFQGSIPVVMVYGKVISQNERTELYNTYKKRYIDGTSMKNISSSSSITVDEMSSVNTLVANLTATDPDTTDFTFSLVSGNGTNDQHNSLFTVSGTQLLVAGNIDYETNSTLNIYVQASDGANTYAKALTVNVNDINEPPVISATTLSNDNSSINITFSEAVYSTNGGSGALEVSDFVLSISGGTATLSSTTPSSISVNGSTYTLGLTLSGTPDGNETVTVVPVQDSIYDTGAATASTTQSNNTVSLNGDSDSDGVNDVLDQCSNTPGGASVDVNGCAESQKDPDNDGITGINDNCPNISNSNQIDTDGDGLGDACDPDIDDDGIPNGSDNCPSDYNPDQKNNDNDNQGDLCDLDDDNDGYSDFQDFFPLDPLEWLDTDSDGIGNNADTDDDNDTYLDAEDAFPLNLREWLDNDKDGIGDNADKDDDNDGVEDREDDLPLDPNEYLDTDKDGIGNNADQDDDGDGYKDQDEIQCDSDPLKRSSKPRDYDRDLIPNCMDTDDDNDGCLDQEDLFPLNERECIDTDGDGIGDNSDMDADNDGILDEFDDFPTDPNESKDTDGDGIGDNADQDDNNDGFPEDPITNSAGEEVIPIFVSELLTPNQSGEESRWRIVNIDKYPTANVKIYSPSGIIVFESWDYKNDWDGRGKNGKPLPNGPYMYMIDRGDETLVEEGWLYIFN